MIELQGPICTVYFRSRDGCLAGHVTQAHSVFDACRNALAWFADTSYWKGPQPDPETIFEVQVVSRKEKWHVKGRPRYASRLRPSRYRSPGRRTSSTTRRSSALANCRLPFSGKTITRSVADTNLRISAPHSAHVSFPPSSPMTGPPHPACNRSA
ncbi:MAG: hypothetical protein JO091_11950 [Acidobacteriaceae bacterium]|nr:hypothetical protein [Acidobacteriaceae bacterium]